MNNQSLIDLTADIVAAHVSNNSVPVGDVANLIQSVHDAPSGLDTPSAPEIEARKPVVSVRTSIKPDFITCLACGSKQKTLKRHLQRAHDLSPDQYRQEFNLPASYPMVAPNYSEQRRSMAQKIGLGRKPKETPEKPAKAQPKRRARTSKSRP